MNHQKNIGLDQADLEQYVTEHSQKEDPILYELYRKTHLKLYHPRRSSDHLSGLFLKMISQMIKPSRILEIGTFSGYGTICLAEGLDQNGLLHTIEINDELEDFIMENLQAAGIEKQVRLHIGDAKKIIPKLDEKFDLVFMDAEKDEYSSYYDLVIDKIKPGGFLLADNVLWSGKVVEDKLASNDHFTKGIKAFNEKVQNDPRVENQLLPIFDGLMVVRVMKG